MVGICGHGDESLDFITAWKILTILITVIFIQYQEENIFKSLSLSLVQQSSKDIGHKDSHPMQVVLL